mmetsp:Transcript_11857/g.16379  ORF Transcript_11857/g.16379 Transcript_11857/m.16379 type:complete len:423 (-) Transcript_11857:199-1467(-)
MNQTGCNMGTSTSSPRSFSTTKVSTLPMSSSTAPSKEPNCEKIVKDNKECAKNVKTADTTDIEDLHQIAVKSGSNTYIDPSTGFMVFTELAHLKRGKCCGSMCRHCPYGWENVRTKNGTSTQTRKAKVQSGDVAMAKELIHKIQNTNVTTSGGDSKYKTNGLTSSSSPAPHTKSSPLKTQTGKGGRHGGRHTSKNVPYTRNGDRGTSQLLTGERRKKNDDSFEAMGTVDELCSIVGTVHAELLAVIEKEGDETMTFYGDLPDWLLDVMSRLFDVGSHVANPRRRREKDDIDIEEEETNDFTSDGVGGGFDPEHIDELEDWIDEITDELPELNSFVLPTGGKASAQLHVARTVCRRAERRTISLVEEGVCDPNALRYLNRLSDFFFTAARWTNYCEGREEIQYRRPYRGANQRGRVKINLDQK